MKILFTSDWQASYENLDLCSGAAEEILQLKEKHEFETLVLCGDLKHVYNPVDIRVINFWQSTIKNWIKKGLDVVVLLGNHDRLGLYNEKPNWMPVLRNAGAKAFDEPAHLALPGGGFRLALLPFRQDAGTARKEAADLASLTGPNKRILVFHADLQSARYNVLSTSSTSVLTVKDLHSQRYVYCIGGHLHLRQKLCENVYYVGSPFATDWGEANQKKGYLLFDGTSEVLKKINSEIPGWYDPAWPHFEDTKPDSWKGTHVRIKVPCSSLDNVRELVQAATRTAERRYVGAQLSVVPEFTEQSRDGAAKIKPAYTDEKKIRIYLKETLPEALKPREGKIKDYLLEQLKQAGGLQREGGELTFESVNASNFLSYKELKVQLEKGLTVVSGKNKDWMNRSNGSGKTSYLQAIAVALFGQTFKGQKHDHWMRRGTENGEKSFVSVRFKDSQDRECKVFRGRHPNKLKLTVNGELLEGGNLPKDTQRLIEMTTGYTWETLSNAVYIDQSSTHLMLTGTEAQRKGFLAKLQNLERFERALKLVTVDKRNVELTYEATGSKTVASEGLIKELHATISTAKKTMSSVDEVRKEFLKARDIYRTLKAELLIWEDFAKNRFRTITNKIAIVQKDIDEAIEQQAIRTEAAHELGNRLKKFTRLEGECPTCFQPVDAKLVEKHIKKWKEQGQELLKKAAEYKTTIQVLRDSRADLEKSLDKWRRNQQLAIKVGDAHDNLLKAREKLKQCKKESALLAGLKDRIAKENIALSELKEKRTRLAKRLEIIKYSQSVFQRDGLPSFLNAQICPELNSYAREYAEIFAQSEIQVHFGVDAGGQLDVKVLNAHGGENVEDQSEGEMRMASLITSFAVRSLAPKTNLLILDEPGDGLDPISARNFAKGLLAIAKKFAIILVTTHSPAILSELADSRTIQVVKENGVSQVVS
jgi:DNA repair exonuclease SbcCD nuclease subunit/predicted ATPase